MGAVENNTGVGWDLSPADEYRRGFTRWFVQAFQSTGSNPDGEWYDMHPEGFATEEEAKAAITRTTIPTITH